MSEQIDLDVHSLRILEALQENAHLTVQQRSERVGLSTPPVWKRIERMQASPTCDRASC
ncbi:MAG: Lrp/AsnC family transcriptional regulator [Lautropia sp.]